MGFQRSDCIESKIHSQILRKIERDLACQNSGRWTEKKVPPSGNLHFFSLHSTPIFPSSQYYHKAPTSSKTLDSPFTYFSSSSPSSLSQRTHHLHNSHPSPIPPSHSPPD